MASRAFSKSLGKIKLSWLDLRGSGLSVIERLCLEETLLRHDPEERSWAIVGTHEPTTNRFMKPLAPVDHVSASANPNQSCIIVMGIGGKPNELLNMDLVRQDGVLIIKRFSGGGTVVLDHSSIWTTFIGRNNDFQHMVDPYPRNIMKWSAEHIFDPTFRKLKRDSILQKSNIDANSNSNIPRRNNMVMETENLENFERRSLAIDTKPDDILSSAAGIPDFSLRDHDYVLGERKMGGNAQAIIKGGWLHHTSFLWDYQDEHMEYLSLPKKRPEYRADRSHDDFLVKLSTQYGFRGTRPFFTSIKEACDETFEIEQVTMQEALKIVNDQVGGLQNFFDGKCRTRLIKLE